VVKQGASFRLLCQRTAKPERAGLEKFSAFTKGILDWRRDNAAKGFTASFRPGDGMVWGRTDRVVKDGVVVEFG
jgi:hypothetical protein